MKGEKVDNNMRVCVQYVCIQMTHESERAVSVCVCQCLSFYLSVYLCVNGMCIRK